MKLPVYKLSVNQEDAENGEYLGILEIANTKSPAIQMKGIAFSEVQTLMFKDDLKYRIASPALTPSKIYRRDPETNEEYYVEVTPETVEQIFIKFQKDRAGQDIFNIEHDENKRVPSYILETWLVENPELDKSYTTYGILCKAKTWFVVQQFTDVNAYNEIVKNGQIGFSIHGNGALKLSKQVSRRYSDVILLNDKNQVLTLLRTKDDEFEPSKYGFPGGKNDGELESVTAVRELFEEAGIKPSALLFLEEVTNEDNSITSYYYTTCKDEIKLSEEHVSYKWMSVDDLSKAPVILNQNERFVNLTEKALKLSKQVKQDTMIKFKSKRFVATFTQTTEADGGEIIVTADTLEQGAEVVVVDENFQAVESFSGEVMIDEEKVVITDNVITEIAKTEEVEATETEEKEEVEVEMTEGVKEEVKEEVEMAEEPTADTYTRAEVDAKLDEIYAMIAEMKVNATPVEATEEPEPVEMSKDSIKLSKVEQLSKFINRK